MCNLCNFLSRLFKVIITNICWLGKLQHEQTFSVETLTNCCFRGLLGEQDWRKNKEHEEKARQKRAMCGELAHQEVFCSS